MSTDIFFWKWALVVWLLLLIGTLGLILWTTLMYGSSYLLVSGFGLGVSATAFYLIYILTIGD